MAETTYILKGSRLRETDKAVHFYIEYIDGVPFEGDEASQWFPEKFIVRSIRGKHKGEDEIVVTQWIMATKELI